MILIFSFYGTAPSFVAGAWSTVRARRLVNTNFRQTLCTLPAACCVKSPSEFVSSCRRTHPPQHTAPVSPSRLPRVNQVMNKTWCCVRVRQTLFNSRSTYTSTLARRVLVHYPRRHVHISDWAGYLLFCVTVPPFKRNDHTPSCEGRRGVYITVCVMPSPICATSATVQEPAVLHTCIQICMCLCVPARAPMHTHTTRHSGGQVESQ